jgi:lipid-binding SYLF domain-containing protein
MMSLDGGGFGLQIGGQATDYVILVMNNRGARSVISDPVKLGDDASIGAGPIGRATSAQTDVVMNAEMLSWSRTQGLFAGVSLEGATLRPDNHANQILYGRELNAKEIVTASVMQVPAAAQRLTQLLDKLSPSGRSGLK